MLLYINGVYSILVACRVFFLNFLYCMFFYFCMKSSSCHLVPKTKLIFNKCFWHIMSGIILYV